VRAMAASWRRTERTKTTAAAGVRREASGM
jgi:hypothetical protein